MYVIGKTGMGKTVLLKNMAVQDIQEGKGMGFVDPHGEAAEELLDFVPANRINDVIYFNPADLDYPIAFNIMEKVDVAHRHLVSSGLMGVFKKIWPDVWSARMEYILNNSILALLEYPGSTLLGVNRMLADPEYRKKIVDKVTDPVVKSFWVQEFARYTQRYEVEATAAIQNKIGQFISNPLIRNIIGQVRSSINMREIMDEKKILILDLSKGRIGEDNSRLLGALLITKLQLAAMSRVDIPEEERQDFFLYVDEFQNFATESFANILSEARKYRLALILGHQYINQLIDKGNSTVSDAVFGNVGTLISFRVGAEDAEYLEKEFAPEFVAEDLVNLPKYNIYLKLMINGLAGAPFSAETTPPIPKLEESNREKIIKVSRERYGTPKNIIEEKIAKWTGMMEMPEISSQGQGHQIQNQQSSQVLYDAKCSLCGKWTKVIFPPDGTRPIYCKTCLKQVKKPHTLSPQGLSSQFETNRQSFQSNSKESGNFMQKREIPPEKTEVLPERRETTPSVSLEEATTKAPVSFSQARTTNDRPKRKEVNLEELKKTLEESLKDVEPENNNENTKGI